MAPAGKSHMRLDKALQSQGYGSRKECRAMVDRGRVSYGHAAASEPEGEPLQPPALVEADDPDAMLETEGLWLALDGEAALWREHVYVVLHKPSGYECSRKATAHPSVLELLPPEFLDRGVQPVGRLDQDTTGLLLLSDDGAFIHQATSPSRHVPKTYVATTEYPPDPSIARDLLAGVVLHDDPEPIQALSCERTGERELTIVVEQGKYHQIKRMIAAAGNHCAALRRTAIGGLLLSDLGLEEGEWRYLSQRERGLVARQSD